MDYSSSPDDSEEDDISSSDAGSSLDCKVSHRQVVPTQAGGPSTSGLDRAAALGMDVGVFDESREQNSRTTIDSSVASYASNMKKTIMRLMKKTKQNYAKKKNKQKEGHKRMPSEDDAFTTDAIASQISSGASLVNRLGMAPEPVFTRSQSQRSVPRAEQQPVRSRTASAPPGALYALLGNDDGFRLKGQQYGQKSKCSFDATIDFSENGVCSRYSTEGDSTEQLSAEQKTLSPNGTVGKRENIASLQPFAGKRNLQDLSPSVVTPSTAESGQSIPGPERDVL
eukprot:scaffold4617_cov106-Cylindrotheca_fusiformis.AAC.7